MLKAIKISDFIIYISVNILLRKNQSRKEFVEIINNKIVINYKTSVYSLSLFL